jgi:hypothetical protein
MRNGTLAAGLLVTLSAGFIAGRISSSSVAGHDHSNGESTAGTAPLKTRVGERPPVERPSSQGARLKQEIRAQSADRIPQLVFKALETGDPILRRQLMSDLYSRMDHTNYREMMNQILEISNTTAREYPEEYLLMSMRAGQIAGQEVMEDWKKEGIATEAASKSFAGWAHVDPASAKAWLDSQTDLHPGARHKLLNTLIAGTMVHDPAKAREMLSSMPQADRDACLNTFTNNIVQAAGKDAGYEWLKTIQSNPQDPDFAKRATTSIFDRVLWSGANRRNASSMVKDLEGISPYVTIDENWISRSMGQIRDRKITGGIDLLDEISRSPILKDQPITPRLWNSAVDFALQRDRGAVDKWLEEHPDSPIHAQVREMAERKKAQAATAMPPTPN